MDSRYPAVIEWSDDDGAFVVQVPDLPGCMAHGVTCEEAARHAEEAIQMWIEAARQDGRLVPAPSRHILAA